MRFNMNCAVVGRRESMWDREVAAAGARRIVALEERAFYAVGTVGGNLGCLEPTTPREAFS